MNTRRDEYTRRFESNHYISPHLLSRETGPPLVLLIPQRSWYSSIPRHPQSYWRLYLHQTCEQSRTVTTVDHPRKSYDWMIDQRKRDQTTQALHAVQSEGHAAMSKHRPDTDELPGCPSLWNFWRGPECCSTASYLPLVHTWGAAIYIKYILVMLVTNNEYIVFYIQNIINILLSPQQ